MQHPNDPGEGSEAQALEAPGFEPGDRRLREEGPVPELALCQAECEPRCPYPGPDHLAPGRHDLVILVEDGPRIHDMTVSGGALPAITLNVSRRHPRRIAGSPAAHDRARLA